MEGVDRYLTNNMRNEETLRRERERCRERETGGRDSGEKG